MYSIIGSNGYSFDMRDMYADTDSYNIFMSLKNNESNSLAGAFKSYYSFGYRSRYSNFTNYWDEDTIRTLVETYTSTTYLVSWDFLRWPLFTRTDGNGNVIKYSFFETQSKAATDAFVNYIMEQVYME